MLLLERLAGFQLVSAIEEAVCAADIKRIDEIEAEVTSAMIKAASIKRERDRIAEAKRIDLWLQARSRLENEYIDKHMRRPTPEEYKAAGLS